jgi:hypothetical protein
MASLLTGQRKIDKRAQCCSSKLELDSQEHLLVTAVARNGGEKITRQRRA